MCAAGSGDGGGSQDAAPQAEGFFSQSVGEDPVLELNPEEGDS